jgi:hypothetical protein
MTTQDLGRADGDLGVLFDRSPEDRAHTAPAAEVSFVLGLVALAIAPFTLTFGLCVMLAGLCVVTSVVGLAQASLSLGALALVGLRYLDVDTAFGDSLVPHIHSMLQSLNDLVPSP